MVAGLLDVKLQLISSFLRFTITSFVCSWACRVAAWELASLLPKSLSLLAGHSPKSAKAVQRVIHRKCRDVSGNCVCSNPARLGNFAATVRFCRLRDNTDPKLLGIAADTGGHDVMVSVSVHTLLCMSWIGFMLKVHCDCLHAWKWGNNPALLPLSSSVDMTH